MDNPTNKPIIKTNYGLASAYDQFIEINYKIDNDLREKIEKHERSHRTGRYTQKDFMLDFQSTDSYFWQSFKFALMNPEALISFFPAMYSYYAKSWTFNWSAIFPFLYFGIIFSIVFFLTIGVPFINSFICFTVLFVILNIILLGVTHYIVKKDKDFSYKQIN